MKPIPTQAANIAAHREAMESLRDVLVDHAMPRKTQASEYRMRRQIAKRYVLEVEFMEHLSKGVGNVSSYRLVFSLNNSRLLGANPKKYMTNLVRFFALRLYCRGVKIGVWF